MENFELVKALKKTTSRRSILGLGVALSLLSCTHPIQPLTDINDFEIRVRNAIRAQLKLDGDKSGQLSVTPISTLFNTPGFQLQTSDPRIEFTAQFSRIGPDFIVGGRIGDPFHRWQTQDFGPSLVTNSQKNSTLLVSWQNGQLKETLWNDQILTKSEITKF